jgi:hypothetical protein
MVTMISRKKKWEVSANEHRISTGGNKKCSKAPVMKIAQFCDHILKT